MSKESPDKYGELVKRLRAKHSAYGKIGALRHFHNQAADAIEELSTPSHVAPKPSMGDYKEKPFEIEESTASGVQQADALPAVHQGQETKASGHCAPPSTTAQKPDDEARRFAEWDALNKAIGEYVSEYEHGDNGYQPTRQERLLIFDCIQGLLVEQAYLKAIAQVYPIRTQFASVPSAMGTSACPLCGVDHPHQHDLNEQCVFRLGHRILSEWTDHDKRWLVRMAMDLIRVAKANNRADGAAKKEEDVERCRHGHPNPQLCDMCAMGAE